MELRHKIYNLVMNQMRIFEIPKPDWIFLEKYQKNNIEYKGWVEIHHSYLNLELRYLEKLSNHNYAFKKDVIEFEDLKARKILLKNLKFIQKELQWIPYQIEDIKVWLDHNRERAANIS